MCKHLYYGLPRPAAGGPRFTVWRAQIIADSLSVLAGAIGCFYKALSCVFFAIDVNLFFPSHWILSRFKRKPLPALATVASILTRPVVHDSVLAINMVQ